MKNLLIAFILLGTYATSFAQIKTPAPSPSAKIEQTVGLTDVTIEYSRPAVKNRDIFSKDGLVPFGKLWRTGANAVTKISFSEDVSVQGNELPKGSYAVLTVPGEKSWAVNFYPYEGRSWSSYKEKETTAVATVEPKTKKYSTESFTISVDDLKSDGATINLKWDRTKVSLALAVHTDKQAMSSIDKLLAGPSKGDYYRIASYYHSSGKDLDKALEFITTATDGDDKKFWQVRRKALILADLGKTKEAIKAAKLSLELAQKAENMDYVKMNEVSIKEWSM